MNDTVKRSKGSAINRVLEIIELISVSERPLAPADLAFTLDIPKPSIHRLLQQLEEDGFVRTDWRGQIVPGARLVKTAVGALSSRVQENMRQSVLQRLAAEVGETCGIAIPRDMEMLYTDRVQSNWPLQIYLPVGCRVPVWCTSGGKLYLSTLTKAQRSRLIGNMQLEALTRNSLVEKAALEADIAEIAHTGVSNDNEEFIAGMVACSVAIAGPDDRYFASLFVHAPTLRCSLEQLHAFLPQMRQAARELSQLLKESAQ
ncbi:IclR family transcriptional regulator [Pluralibacter gergoviae]|uniref:HTH-type transcriptional repressor AllR n=1 Tax=Pluralibacter gergoviae TaxID=61647 RepID=A0AAI9DFB6_PLUGE|nr:IclR family transcriptional regulator [Pluralibacter gergoviae]AVR04156.1 IclR family transcriptional regulator [Pluralibacter gergoviae]EKV0914263.1 IclR family transcriptional regulator [Pluralibacter gergoviae]EKV0928862.1 IclR family transcriptional regulator [Pluralibacter gergoviae]EKV6246240.1 IclR family transcriptional regulator [Pluralibacter gergoviae]EKV9910018.1 IclR family transcriptional regulator [Pluralibacter gergoviae]